MKKITKLSLRTILFLSFLGVLLFIDFHLVSAQTIFKPQIGVGTEFPVGVEKEITGWAFAEYIVAFYKWSVRAIAVLAVVMIMKAGFQWMTSAGNAPAISRAKDQMISAIIGLVLALGANLLLTAINPALTRFKKLEIATIENIAACPGGRGWNDVSPNEGFQKCAHYCIEEMVSEVNSSASKPIPGTNIFCCECGEKLLTKCDEGDEKVDYTKFDYFTGCCKHCLTQNLQVDKCYAIDTKIDLGIDFTCVKCVSVVKGREGCEQENRGWGMTAGLSSSCAYNIGNEAICKRHSDNNYECVREPSAPGGRDFQCRPKYKGPGG
ncbi:MAG: pilin [Patescibacteria group bacterium]